MAKMITWLRLTEGSTVDVPAQEGARFVLFKRGATKSESDGPHPASDYAYVPDPEMPSTWKLRIDDAQHVAAAAAALGPGFRGQKVQIPSGDIAAVRAKVRAAWHKFYPDRPDDEMPGGLRGKRAGGHRGSEMDEPEVMIETLQKQVDALTSAIDAAGFKVDSGRLVEKSEEDIYKGVPEALRKQMQADKAEREELRKKLAQAQEREEIVALEKRAGEITKLAAKPEEIVSLLKGLDGDGRDLLMRVLRGADEMVAKGAEVLNKANGKDGEPADGVDPEEKVRKMAAELRKENSDLSEADALNLVFQRNPGAYDAYRGNSAAKR